MPFGDLEQLRMAENLRAAGHSGRPEIGGVGRAAPSSTQGCLQAALPFADDKTARQILSWRGSGFEKQD
jgi:hypothetical protein